MQRHAYELRAKQINSETREITGLAVPYDTPTKIFSGWSEQIARGAVTLPAGTLPLFRDHRNPIGTVVETWDTNEGLAMRATISNTPLGEETLTLLRDGAISGLSIAFIENEFTDNYDEAGDNLRTQTRITLREISVVPFPAYDDAEVKQVREKLNETTPINRKENPVMENTNDKVAAELAEVRAELNQFGRELATMATNTATAPTVENRSMGELLKAVVVERDDTAVNALNTRNATPQKSTDDASFNLMPTAIKNLVEIINQGNPLAAIFPRLPLPETGNTIEYLRVRTNAITVENYTEGGKVPFNKLETETATATIKMHAGGTFLTRTAIERSAVNVLSTNMEALAVAAANHSAAGMTAFLKQSITDNTAKALTTKGNLGALTWDEFKDLVIDANVKMRAVGLSPDTLIVDLPTFKVLTSWKDTTGAPLVSVQDAGVNRVGEANIKNLEANIFIRIIPDFRADTANYFGDKVLGAFVDSSKAIKYYASPVVNLSEGDITNLTEAFAVYYYDAPVLEYSDGLIPLKVKA
ncbi:phage prohead protease, HK97 family [Gleimia coleocanis DSM 15436]|uniref:Phage prohead protease, HK97 family n=1 Tax=Gleimia coleocanis DSM 15436 TaxID=525245 RepID=C0VY84_9ACTO|nr:HK97 family phage prohead protease [Gleimia coleocanis]EEH64387.1 phage prohead protease, HK97 family [Gleimia coleocanis DSM 15436]